MTWPACLRVPTTDGTEVEIRDPERFCTHLQSFHGAAAAIHTEQGYAFKVDDSFRDLVQAQTPRVALFG